MNITTRNRNELKTYFQKYKIPTESQFAQLIDAGLNQNDDGLFKLSGQPLGIVAKGSGSYENSVLNFYGDVTDDVPDWTLNIKPFGTPGDAGTARTGFGINDSAGNNRFFIDSTSGNVGIGTNNPGVRLEVNGDFRASGISHFAGNVGIGQPRPMHKLSVEGTIYVVGRISIGDLGPIHTLTVGGTAHVSGNMGIGQSDPQQRLVVSGTKLGTNVTGNGLKFAGTMAIKSNEPQLDFVDTDGSDWAIHVNSNQMLFIFENSTVNWNDTGLILSNNGSVGIGLGWSKVPEQKLSVNGYIASKTVYFSAYVSAPVTGDQAKIPLTIRENMNAVYNDSTFSAPIAGIYLFTMTAICDNQSKNNTGILSWSLKVNGKYANSSDGSKSEQCSVMVISPVLISQPLVNSGFTSSNARIPDTSGSRTILVRLAQNDAVTVSQSVEHGAFTSLGSGLEGVLLCAIDTQITPASSSTTPSPLPITNRPRDFKGG